MKARGEASSPTIMVFAYRFVDSLTGTSGTGAAFQPERYACHEAAPPPARIGLARVRCAASTDSQKVIRSAVPTEF